MSIEFVSRAAIKKALKENMIDTKNTAVISVSDTPSEFCEMWDLIYDYYKEHNGGSSTQDFLALDFADDEESFSEVDAKAILAFIKQHGTKKNYLVHCFAGVSRSGAIAKYINEYLDAGEWYLEDYMGHNRHVFNMLHKVAGTSLIAYYEALEKEDRKVTWED